MKTVLAAFAGFASAMLLFAGGAYSTLLILTAEPRPAPSANADVADLWTSEPRRIEVSTQRLERAEPLPTGRTAAAEPQAASDDDVRVAATAARTIDPAVAPATAGLSGNNDRWIAAAASAGADAAARDLSMHVAWCSERYRSYRPEDNSYVSYGGKRRACMSDFTSGGGGSILEASEALYVEAIADDALPSAIADGAMHAGFDAGHAESCFARYRSYRAEDNSYQPYGGGPRRQCE